jgi:hypothetical protein
MYFIAQNSNNKVDMDSVITTPKQCKACHSTVINIFYQAKLTYFQYLVKLLLKLINSNGTVVLFQLQNTI